MSVTVSITKDAIFTAVRTYLLTLIDCEIIQGLGNGVPTPDTPFISITPLFRKRLSTNITSYTDPVLTADDDDPPPPTGTQNFEEHAQYTIQIDCYGPLSSDWASIIETMWRSTHACDGLAPDVTPLHADDAIQMASVDGEYNFEERWCVTANLQYNPVVKVPMQFFDAATVGLINVDVEYPPT